MKEKLKLLIGISTIAAVLSGCSTVFSHHNNANGDVQKITKSSNENTSNIQEDKLDVNLIKHETADNSIEFSYEVKNKSGKDMNFVFNNGKQFDYILKDEKGKVVIQDSKNKMYSQSVVTHKLLNGNSLVKPIKFKELSKGKYILEVWMEPSAPKGDYKRTIQFEVN